MLRSLIWIMQALQRFEGRGVFLEVELDFADRSVTVLGDDHVHDIFVRGVGLVAILAREEDHNVSVLLDGSGFAEVGEFRDLILTRFDASRKLRERHNRDIEFAGELFEAAGNFRDFLDAVVAAARTPFHQLEVVDDYHPEIVLGLEATRHRAHFHNIERARIIDEDRGLAEGADSLADLGEVVALEFAGTQTPQIHTGLRGDHTVDQLVAAHFQGEDADGHFGIHTDLAGDIEREGRLSDGWTRSENDKVGLLKSGEEIVEVGIITRHAAKGIVAFVQLIDTLESIFEDGLDRDEVLLDVFLRDFEEALLGFIEDFLYVFGFVVAHFEDIARGADKSSQHRFFLYHFRVVDDIGSGGDGVDQGSEVAGAADAVEFAFFFETVGNTEDIERLAVFVELEHNFVDVIVGVLVEVSRFEEVGDLDDRVFVQHQRAEHGLLSFEVVGRNAQLCHQIVAGIFRHSSFSIHAPAALR